MSDKNKTENREYIAEGKAHGETAGAVLSSNFSLDVLAQRYRNLNFSSLPPNYWKEIDKRIAKVARAELIGMADLQRSAENIKINRKGKSVHEYYKVSEMSGGNIVMSPDERGTSDVLDFSPAQIPLPIVKKEFWHELFTDTAAKENSFNLLMQLTDAASFVVANDLEEFLFNGIFTPAAGLSAYGYTQWPERNEFTPASSPVPFADWTTVTLENIVDQVKQMVEVLWYQNHDGPYKLYIPRKYKYLLDSDYTTGSNEYPLGITLRERILKIEGMSEIATARKLADDNVLLVEMSQRSLGLIQGLPMTVMDWEPPNTPNWKHMYKAMSCMVPLFKSDYEGQNGILHAHL